MAADGCGTPIGGAVPSKAPLVSFSAAAQEVVAESGEGLSAVIDSDERKSVVKCVISHVLTINLLLEPVLDKKVSGSALLELLL